MPRYPRVSPAIAAMPGAVYSALAHRLAAHRGETWPFHVGDTWMEPAPGCRIEDLTVAEHPGLHRYAPVQGLPALVDAICERTTARTGLPTERAEVLVTAGATGGLGAVLGGLLAPGDEVVILAPYWPLIAGIVSSLNGRPVPVPLLGAHGPEALAEAVSAAIGPRTVALYFNTPNNPTGRVLTGAELEALARLARDHDLWLLADEVYEDYVYEGSHVHGRALAPERTLSAWSFSKAFGMAGNRVGYLVGPAPVMAEVRKVGTHTFYAAPTASQLAAARALAGPGDDWVRAARAQYAATGAEAARRLGVPPPQGSTFLFLDVARYLDERGLPGLLEDCADQGLLLAPGPSFGPFPRHARLCFTAVDPQATLRGVDRLAALLARRSPAGLSR